MNGQAKSPCRKTLVLLSLHSPNLSRWGQIPSWSVVEGWKRVIPHPDDPRSQYSFWTHVYLNMVASFFSSFDILPFWHIVLSKAECILLCLYVVVFSQLHHVGLHLFPTVRGGETVHIVLVAEVGHPKIHNCTASFKQLKITECSSLVWCNFPVWVSQRKPMTNNINLKPTS